MKKNKEIWIWFYAILFVLSLVIGILSAVIFEGIWEGIIASFIVVILILPITLIKAWTVVRHQHEYTVEVYGQYIGHPLTTGSYWLFPWFGYVVIKASSFMKTQLMELYIDEESGKTSSIEFIDCSSPVRVSFYFTIVDSAKAVYATNNLLESLAEKVDSLVRAFLGSYTIREVMTMKHNFSIHVIANMDDVRSSKFSEKKAKKTWRSSDFYRCLNYRWGVEPDDIVIADFDLPASVAAARERILSAEKDLEASFIAIKTAENTKHITIKAGEAAKRVEELRGEGVNKSIISIALAEAEKINLLTKSGVPAEDLVRLMIQDNKWDAVKSTDKVIITNGDDNSGASYGAQVAAGFGATQSVATATPKVVIEKTEKEEKKKD